MRSITLGALHWSGFTKWTTVAAVLTAALECSQYRGSRQHFSRSIYFFIFANKLLALRKAFQKAPFTFDIRNPAPYLAVCILLSLAAVLAMLGPVWRGSRADPLVALRHESAVCRPYSLRKATAGSTAIDRRAGTQLPAAAATARTPSFGT